MLIEFFEKIVHSRFFWKHEFGFAKRLYKRPSRNELLWFASPLKQCPIIIKYTQVDLEAALIEVKSQFFLVSLPLTLTD